jgi:hypothetical protein
MAVAAGKTGCDAADESARRILRALAAGEQLTPILRRLLLGALVNENRSDRPHAPKAFVSSAARSATQWIGAGYEEREKVLRDLLQLADALPPQPKHGPSLPDKISLIDQALEEAAIPHAFGGALAVGYYGEPRATGDIDINVFISIESWPSLKDVLTPLEVEIDVEQGPPGEAHEWKLEWGGTPLHLFFSCDPLHKRMHQEVRRVIFNGDTIPLIAPEHLIIRKAILDRPKDWHDIEQILVASSPLELNEVGEWLQRMIGKSDGRPTKLEEIAKALKLA